MPEDQRRASAFYFITAVSLLAVLWAITILREGPPGGSPNGLAKQRENSPPSAENALAAEPHRRDRVPPVPAGRGDGGRSAVSGVVLDPTGSAVAEASVKAFRPRNATMGIRVVGEAHASARTDEHGRFRMTGLDATDRLLLQAAAPGHGRVERDHLSVRFGSDTVIEPLILTTPGAISGRVTTRDGWGVPRVQIQVTPRGESQLSLMDPPEFTAWTDEDGSYVAPDLAPGLKDLRVIPEHHAFTGRAGVMVTAGATTARVDFVLELGRSISGVVISTLGEPISGALIDAYFQEPLPFAADDDDSGDDAAEVTIESWGEARSDGDGRFTVLGLAPGRYSLTVRAEGFEPVDTTLISSSSRRNRIQLDPECRLEGRVVAESTGEPITRFFLSIGVAEDIGDTPHLFDADYLTDDDGRFSVSVPCGSVCIARAFAPELAMATSAQIRAAADLDPLTLRLGPGATVGGRLRAGSTGLPLASVPLRLVGRSPDVRAAWWFGREAKLPWPETVTDAEGDFCFDNVAPGIYRLLCDEAEHVLARKNDFEVESRPVSLGDVSGFRAGALVGVVRDRKSSTPIPGRTVIARQGEKLFLAISDDDGNFRLRRLPPGQYKVSSIASPAEPWMDDATVFEGEETQIVVH